MSDSVDDTVQLGAASVQAAWDDTTPVAGELTLLGRLVMASNATFLAEDEAGFRWVYKPVRGEAPLRDFPDGTLGQREIAAWELSRVGGWQTVPFTCAVEGPFGLGSAQRWLDDATDDLAELVSADQVPDDWHAVVAGVDADDHDVVLVTAPHPQLRRLALFDVVANNADRKGGHILHVPATDSDPTSEAVLGVDHGLTFHTDDKLRTILWGWAAAPLDDDEIAVLNHTLEVFPEALQPWLSDAELAAVEQRITDLLIAGRFPEPGEGWRYIPWPPF